MTHKTPIQRPNRNRPDMSEARIKIALARQIAESNIIALIKSCGEKDD